MAESKHEFFDLRILVGILFTVYGLILGIYGLAAAPKTADTSWHIDFWWGLLILIFGLIFLAWSRRPQRLDD
ncbi:MAG: hypothetical protein K6T83_01810 [Alicyclobacillus sp.]|nr:hypothetical protein [Alicyclobacillus sp.]